MMRGLFASKTSSRAMLRPLCAALLAFGLAPQAMALTLDLPGNPRLMWEEVTPDDSLTLPIGRWSEAGLATRLTEGEITRQVWRLAQSGMSSLAVTSDLRGQLQAQGFAILLDCAAPICGGFDFRSEIEVLPPPAMHLNLGDFRYLTAELTRAGAPERVGILVSTSAETTAVQILRAGAPRADAPLALPAPLPVPTAPAGQVPQAGGAVTDDFAFTLESQGRVVLGDLRFDTGSAQLAEGEFASLHALAAYLRAHPARRIMLVGHTDTSGGLDVNAALSKRRAASVVERLARDYGVQRQQITAEGAGYLAPLRSNLSPEGREDNRRVEAVLLGTE